MRIGRSRCRSLASLLGVFVFVFYVFYATAAAVQQRAGGAAASRVGRLAEYVGALSPSRQRSSRRAAPPVTAFRRRAPQWRQRADCRGATGPSASGRPLCRPSADKATALVKDTTGDRGFSDVNYIIPTFVLTQLPVGLVGVLIVAILMAATDTIAGELNSLATATVIDFYRRRIRTDRDRLALPTTSKIATGLWGLFACAVAVWAAELGSLIEVVNRFGSFFYGSISARSSWRSPSRARRRTALLSGSSRAWHRWPGRRPLRTSRSSGTT